MTSPAIIGSEHTYDGEGHPSLVGLKVRIVAVHRGGDEGMVLREDSAIGQVEVTDMVEVQPWIASEGRWSFVTSDAHPWDLDLPAPDDVDPAAGRTFSLDGGEPVSWGELAEANDWDTMLEIGLIEVGEEVTVGMCDRVKRLS